MTRHGRSRAKVCLLVLTALLVSTLPLWTLQGLLYGLAFMFAAFGLGWLGGLLYILIGFRRWESRIDRMARQRVAWRAVGPKRRVRALSQPYGYIGRDCRHGIDQ